MKTIAVYIFHVLLAWIGTTVIEAPFSHYSQAAPFSSMLREDLLTSVVAFGLGFLAYRATRAEGSKWVWIVGLLWFARGAVGLWLEDRSLKSLHGSPGILWQMWGAGCPNDYESCTAWIVYCILLLRVVFYSAGALCSSLFPGLWGASLQSKKQGETLPPCSGR